MLGDKADDAEEAKQQVNDLQRAALELGRMSNLVTAYVMPSTDSGPGKIGANAR